MHRQRGSLLPSLNLSRSFGAQRCAPRSSCALATGEKSSLGPTSRSVLHDLGALALRSAYATAPSANAPGRVTSASIAARLVVARVLSALSAGLVTSALPCIGPARGPTTTRLTSIGATLAMPSTRSSGSGGAFGPTRTAKTTSSPASRRRTLRDGLRAPKRGVLDMRERNLLPGPRPADRLPRRRKRRRRCVSGAHPRGRANRSRGSEER